MAVQVSYEEARERAEVKFVEKTRKQYGLSDDDYAIVRSERNYPNTQRRVRSGIHRKYWDLTWSDYEVEKHTEPTRDALEDWADTFDHAMHLGRGISLVGPPGVGKTMAASLVGMDLIRAGHLVRFVPLASYIAMQHEQFKLEAFFRGQETPESNDARERWWALQEELHIIRNVAHLVILDDVGKEYHSATGYAVDSFDQFLRARYQLGRPTIITSNVPLRAWGETYSPAMQSFLHEATEVMAIEKTGDRRVR